MKYILIGTVIILLSTVVILPMACSKSSDRLIHCANLENIIVYEKIGFGPTRTCDIYFDDGATYLSVAIDNFANVPHEGAIWRGHKYCLFQIMYADSPTSVYHLVQQN